MSSPTDHERPTRYDDAFKTEALRLWKTSRRSAADVAKELGISAATLYLWGRESRGGGGDAAAIASSPLLREMKQEITRLRDENEKLRQQREILKKTLAILSEPHRGAVDAGRTPTPADPVQPAATAS